MTRCASCVVLLVMISLGAPSPALAAIDWYWLDSLSGPSFRGPTFEWRFVCFKDAAPGDKGAQAEVAALHKRTALVPLGMAGSIGPTCAYQRGERRKGSIQLGFGLLSAPAEPRFANNEEVKLTVIQPSISWQVVEGVPVELGFGAGMRWFSSKGFESFHRMTLEPLRVDFRPLDWGASDRYVPWLRAAIVLRFGVVVFPQGFEALAFQDTAGVREPRETKKYLGVALDAEPLLRRLTGTW